MLSLDCDSWFIERLSGTEVLQSLFLPQAGKILFDCIFHGLVNHLRK